MKLFFFILFIAYVIGFIILDSSGDLVEGKNSGIQCGYGYIHKSVIGSGCIECPAGTYNNINDYAGGKCKTCPDGKYSSTGANECHDTRCKSPFINKPGNKDGTDCVCPPDQFYENNNCFKCSDNITGSKTINRSQGGDSSQDCVCPIGTYYWEKDNLTPKCVECKPGTYNDSSGLEPNCSICPAGKYSEAGSSSCSDCPDGHISKEGSGDCSMCPAGTGPNSTKTACEECGIGRFSNPDKTGGVCKTFDEGKCPHNQKFGGSSTGLQDCPPVCDVSVEYTSSQARSVGDERIQQFRFEKNIPFINQISPWDLTHPGETYTTIECGGGDVDTDCGSLSFGCDWAQPKKDPTCKWGFNKAKLNYDDIQDDFYERNPELKTCSDLGNHFKFWAVDAAYGHKTIQNTV